MTVRLLQGDCLEVMQTLADESVDSVVTDPPYGIRFMGKAWDGADIEARTQARRDCPSKHDASGPNGAHRSAAAEAGKYDLSPAAMLSFQEFSADWAREVIRVLKPGGYVLAFASTRTYHRMVCGLEEAGFEIRDQIGWLFGSGFPKSKNLGGDWQGWGTALKPAWEPIVVARKPLAKGNTVAANVLAHGTGALNIDGCRVGNANQHGESAWAAAGTLQKTSFADFVGRWPANLIHDGSDEVLAAFPQAPGQQADASTDAKAHKTRNVYGAMRRGRGDEASASSANQGDVGFRMRPGMRRLDEGSAARFFYCAKASRADRNEGCDDLPDLPDLPGGMNSNTSGQHITRRDGWKPDPVKNHHPTVKPTDLMRYLCRLVTPPGGVVLDPFMGSGSTVKAAELEGFSAIGIELDQAYIEIARRRIAADAPLFASVTE